MSNDNAPEKRVRKTRHDKGSIKANNRDILAVTLTAEQYALRFDHIQEFLTRFPGPGVSEEGLSESAARQVVARWKRADWVYAEQLLAGEPIWIWPTKKGIQKFGLAPYTSTPPALSRIRHMHAINAVRLIIQDEGDEWISERAIRAGKFYAKGETGHTPDAILKTDDEVIAIEVELTQKKPDDLHKVLHTLLNAWDEEAFKYRYDQIWYYVTDPAIYKALVAAREKQQYRRDRMKVNMFDLETWDVKEEE